MTEPVHLTLVIDDPEVAAWLREFEEADRPAKAATALRVGVLALRQASGFIDRQAIKDEGKQLTVAIERNVTDAMLEVVGPESKLMKTLDPKRADGLIEQLRAAVDDELAAQGDKVLGAFSLDNENSPLSRLVNYVRQSQEAVRQEFSLDAEGSALSRLLRQLNATLATHEEANAAFREQLQSAIKEMAVRKEAEARGTVHGLEFEEALVDYLSDHASRAGDITSATGATTGMIKNCRIGDCVLQLGPDHRSGGEKIVFEAKESVSYSLASALEEIDKGRRNRQAQVGVFVWSAKSAPVDTERLCRYGRDIVVVWDTEDPFGHVWLDAAIMLAKGLIVEGKRVAASSADVDFDAIERAIEAVAKRAEKADQFRVWGETVENTGMKIKHEAETTMKDLERQVAILREHVDDASSALEELQR